MTKLSSSLTTPALFSEVFDEFLGSWPLYLDSKLPGGRQEQRFVSNNLRGRVAKSDDKETLIEVEVPGVEPSEVKVKIEGRSVSVNTPRGNAYFALGQRLSYDDATAVVKHGMLTITLPKRECKVVEVKVTGD